MECEFCKNTFSTKGNLIAHQKRSDYCLKLQNKVSDKKFICRYCNSEFPRKDNYERHIHIHESDPLLMSYYNRIKELEEIHKNNTTTLQNKDGIIDELKEEIKEYKQTIERLAFANHNNYEDEQNLQSDPESKEEIETIITSRHTKNDTNKKHSEQDNTKLITNRNPVKKLNLARLTPDDFEGCRITPNGKFAIYDVIAKFKGCSGKAAQTYYERLSGNDRSTNCGSMNQTQNDSSTNCGSMNQTQNDRSTNCGSMNQTQNDRSTICGSMNQTQNDGINSFNSMNQSENHETEIFGFIDSYQFPKVNGRKGQSIPVCPFSQLLTILSQLPGEQAKVLRAEQAEISTRAIAGNDDLKEFVEERGKTILPEHQNILMNGLESKNKLEEKISTDITQFTEKYIVYFGGFEPTPEFIEQNKDKIDFDDGREFGKYGKTKQLEVRNPAHIRDKKFIDYKFMNAIVYQNELDMKRGENRVSRILEDLGLKTEYYSKDEVFRYNKEELNIIYRSMNEHQLQCLEQLSIEQDKLNEEPEKNINLELEKYRIEQETEKFRMKKEMVMELFQSKDISFEQMREMLRD